MSKEWMRERKGAALAAEAFAFERRVDGVLSLHDWMTSWLLFGCVVIPAPSTPAPCRYALGISLLTHHRKVTA